MLLKENSASFHIGRLWHICKMGDFGDGLA